MRKNTFDTINVSSEIENRGNRNSFPDCPSPKKIHFLRLALGDCESLVMEAQCAGCIQAIALAGPVIWTLSVPHARQYEVFQSVLDE